MNDIHQITDRERELTFENTMLRKMSAEVESSRDAYQRTADALAAECKVLRDQHEQIRLANIDCIMHFDALKSDYDKLREAAKLGLEKAYLAGFMSSGEGYNGEYPFQDKNKSPVDDPSWLRDRNNAITALKEALGEQT